MLSVKKRGCLMLVGSKIGSISRVCFVLSVSVLLASSVYAQRCNGGMKEYSPESRFNIQGSGALAQDKKTKLVWKRCSEGQVWVGSTCSGSVQSYTWEQALSQAELLNAAEGYKGYKDWRVPNIKELASIGELKCIEPAININVFPAAFLGDYWSSTPYLWHSGNVWGWSSVSGGDTLNKKNKQKVALRLVRGG